MLGIIKAADLDAKQATHIINGGKTRKFSSKNLVEMFKSIHIHFDSSNEKDVDDYFDFFRAAHKILLFRPLKAIYSFLTDICNANSDFREENSKVEEEIRKLKEKLSNSYADNTAVIDSNMKAIKSLESEVDRLNKENESLHTEKEKLQNDIISLQQDVSNYKVENSRLSS